MTNLSTEIITNGESPFDAIRQFDRHGNERWAAHELMHLFTASGYFNSPHKLYTHLEYLNRQECGLLILEACAAYSAQYYVGSWIDSLFLWDSAMSLYCGQSASMIFHGVRMLISNAEKWEATERFLYPIITKHANVIFGECIVVNRNEKADGIDVPDFFVSIESEIIPVEVKKGGFTKADLRQLLRYIKKYQQKGLGIAIAPSIDPKIELPEGVRFIKLDRELVYNLESKPKLSGLIEAKATDILRSRLENQYI